MLKPPHLPANSARDDAQNGRFLHLKIDFNNKLQNKDGETRRRGEAETLFTPNLPFSPSPTLLTILLTLFLACANALAAGTGSTVKFNEEGIALVDGKPFFPIGVFTYGMDPTVLAELREVHANTVLNGFQPNQLDFLQQHGLMAVCFTSDDWVKAAANHPATLAWYLTDEPEGHGVTAEGEKKRYDELKKRDPNHPIGLCHTDFNALTKFKDACDFTMTDIYPITKNRDVNVMGVSIMMDEARRIHGRGWPQWTYIQSFGGPETDAGVWAVPLPHEVRFMAYQALVHRATGILYFSYWPQQPRTWQSLSALNSEIQALVPRLVSPGEERMLKGASPAIQARMRFTATGGFIIAINTSPKPVQTTIVAHGAGKELSVPFEGRAAKLTPSHEVADRFPPYGVHVYTWGPEPQLELAREK